jgi:hypothetical protein
MLCFRALGGRFRFGRLCSFSFAGWLALSLFASLAQGQPLTTDAYKFASPENNPSLTAVNPDAWHSFTSLNATRMFGNFTQQDFSLGVDYTNRVIQDGKKASGRSILPKFTWVGPLFGGEGYTALSGIIPLQSPYAQQLNVKGGWRYHLDKWINLDLGGNVFLYNKSVLASGYPASFGAKQSSPFYVGVVGRCLASPSFYFTYNPDFGESIETLSVEHVFNLGQLACIDGLYIGPKLVVGMVQANDYNGGNKVLGHNWRNGYTYFELQLNADYEVYHGVYLHAGAEWAMNNDGSGSQGIGGTNLGPDDNVSFRAGVVYAF